MRAYCPYCRQPFNTKGERRHCWRYHCQSRARQERAFAAWRERVIAGGGTWYEGSQIPPPEPIKTKQISKRRSKKRWRSPRILQVRYARRNKDEIPNFCDF